MKLRNKKTGEIAEPFGITCINGRSFVQFDDGKGTFKFEARSLAKFNEEWEDISEEPKEYWYIDWTPEIGVYYTRDVNSDADKRQKQIGNYFETKEEAEKAVEKLKAWKRLKDFGCRFILDDHFNVKFLAPDARKITSAEEQKSLTDDYKLLFGGKE